MSLRLCGSYGIGLPPHQQLPTLLEGPFCGSYGIGLPPHPSHLPVILSFSHHSVIPAKAGIWSTVSDICP